MIRISVEELQDRFDEIFEELTSTGEEIEVYRVVCIIKPIPDQEGWGYDSSTEPKQHRAGPTAPTKRNRNKKQ